MKNWEEEFDKQFVFAEADCIKAGIEPKDIRDFIRQHQTTRLKEIRDEIEKLKTHIVEAPYDDYIYTINLQDAIHIVENKLNE